MRLSLATCLLVVLVFDTVAAPVPKKPPLKASEPNSNSLITKYQTKLTLNASSEWANWPVEHAFDGNEETSWYSNGGDAPQNGKTPTVSVTFPKDVRVRRVSIRGNRDPQYPAGYFVLEGNVELLDRDGKVLVSEELKSRGEKHDFDWILGQSRTARTIRFTMTKDQNQSNCVGLGEFQVE